MMPIWLAWFLVGISITNGVLIVMEIAEYAKDRKAWRRRP